MPMPLQPQRTHARERPDALEDCPIATPRAPKRLPSARVAFRLGEIPVVADQMTGTYQHRDRLLFRCNTVWGTAGP